MSGLSVSGLSYAYGSKQALEDVSFSVAPGHFCALLGPNGASLGFGILYIGLWTVMIYLLLYRKKIFIRV